MNGFVTSTRFAGIPGDPKEDPAKLALIGAQVRARLRADPRAEDLGGDKADMFLLHDFFTADECARLVKIIDKKIGPSTLFEGTQRDGFRTSSTHYFEQGDSATRALEKRIDAATGIPHQHAEVTQGQRYEAGQQFKHHYDYFFASEPYWQQERRRGGQRTWTAMLFLNDVEEGGETDWPELGLSVKPVGGALLTWNNMARDGTPNRNTLHAGKPVVKGVKYVITQWYRQDPWTLHLS
ncbi:2OG-Fe(II) oxygenase [Aurantiacibacter suaedae]|uniref:2OG-Fe(II) oxygenase n=1 Tax=Aurantiacibacter suaedae TaxID=2545755 RepID=UPI0010F71C9E|nr:2OG-Fe(II) oxygenase [Aurantiacibacter suaedae]